MEDWLLRISNTHREISVKEIEYILDDTEFVWLNSLLLKITTTVENIISLLNESASIKWVMKNPQIKKIDNDLYQTIDGNEMKKQVPEVGTRTFAARFIQVLEKIGGINKRKLEGYVGALILETFPHLSVDLSNPDQEYRIVISSDYIITGWIYKITDFDEIAKRSPKESPFFGGGAMKPMMSKLLVNLVTKNQNVILDPFCGHGGFLREIAETHRYAVGFEISWKIVRENHVNNHFHRKDAVQVIAADALHPPIRTNGIECVVTDPPYAKQSTTIGRDREDLVNIWLKSANQKTIIMSLPSDMDIKIPQKYNQEYIVKDYVHRSLTRVVRKLVLNE